MGAIYMNATCNIAAAALDATGLFVPRASFIHFSPHFSVEWDSVDLSGSDNSTPVSGFYILQDNAHWFANVYRAHLNQRGWVSQERELSPCTLTFSAQQVYWEVWRGPCL